MSTYDTKNNESLDRRIRFWIDLSDYDIETAGAMIESKRYLYVGFMCHQAVEKMLKAFYVHVFHQHPPKSHNLRLLAGKSSISDHFTDEQTAFLISLEPLNIEARYPTDKEKLLRSLSPERCLRILNSSKELLSWIRSMFEK